MSLGITGNIFPGWEITDEIGQGSYGTVYRIENRENGSVSALKVIDVPSRRAEIDALLNEGMDSAGIAAYYDDLSDKFMNETETMMDLSDAENVVHIDEYRIIKKDDGQGFTLYIRMEYLTPLSAVLTGGGLSEDDARTLACDMCRALEVCSAKGIIHRDIKPENIFISAGGSYKLGDFGIARRLGDASATLSRIGTQNYMAPEVAAGMRYDGKADIYSLGLTLYRLMNNGRMPFLPADDSLPSAEQRQLATERRLSGEKLSAPCNATNDFSRIILKACSPKPSKRYVDAAAMLAALEGRGKKFLTPGNRFRNISIAAAAVMVCALAIAFPLSLKDGLNTADITDDNTYDITLSDDTKSPEETSCDISSKGGKKTSSSDNKSADRSEDIEGTDTDTDSESNSSAETEMSPEDDSGSNRSEDTSAVTRSGKTSSGTVQGTGKTNTDSSKSADTKNGTTYTLKQSDDSKPVSNNETTSVHDEVTIESSSDVYTEPYISAELGNSLYSSTYMSVVEDYVPSFDDDIIYYGSDDFTTDKNTTEIYLKEGETWTGHGSVYCGNLKKLYLPHSLIYLASDPFYYYSGDIYYNGSLARWSQIGTNAFLSSKQFTIHTVKSDSEIQLIPDTAICSSGFGTDCSALFDCDHATSFGVYQTDNSNSLSKGDCFAGFFFDTRYSVNRLCLLWNDTKARTSPWPYDLFSQEYGYCLQYTMDGENWKNLNVTQSYDINLSQSHEFDPYMHFFKFNDIECSGIRIGFTSLPSGNNKLSLYEMSVYYYEDNSR